MPTTDDKQATKATAPRYETGPIVVGSDGSPGGDDAVALAHELAGTSTRRLIAENVPGATPSLGLVGLAEREGAGTLVVGSPHRGAVGRALLGSVAHHVLHHAPCEVVVAPRGFAGRERRPRIAKVGVAYDGTAESRTALRRAEALCRDTGAALHVIVAEDPVVAGIEGGEEFTPLTNAPAVLKAALATVAPTIDADGECLDPGWRKVKKSVAEAIAAACERDVDILVAGTRKPLDRLLLGSVTSRLIDVAPCAVLVVPHDEGA